MKPACIFRTATLVLVSILLAACATPAHVDYREGHDFSAIRSVRMVGPEQLASTDPRVNSPLVDERIRKAISSQLATQGIAVVDDNADATLAYQVGTRSGLESYDSGISVGFGRFGRHSAYGIGYGFPGYDVESYDEIVLTIDFLAVADNALLWRGSGSRRLDSGSTPEKMDELINKLVSGVLANFPPGNK